MTGLSPEAGKKPALVFDRLQIGEEFGPRDYILTPEKMKEYREVIEDPKAAFATIASKDYSYMVQEKYEAPTFINAKHESWYFKPPIVGGRITTRGRLVDKYIKRGRSFIVVETESVQDDCLLVRSRTTLLLAGVQKGEES
ncbi:MAG: hotdog family protein [Chloroflexota bacterium]